MRAKFGGTPKKLVEFSVVQIWGVLDVGPVPTGICKSDVHLVSYLGLNF